ncbi:hypothetical protein BJ912DRAFT_926538 [Pholiota molesta]|nr:hypothetical protein BJ912DRAFT_926538 [Pholiota molesta]
MYTYTEAPATAAAIASGSEGNGVSSDLEINLASPRNQGTSDQLDNVELVRVHLVEFTRGASNQAREAACARTSTRLRAQRIAFCVSFTPFQRIFENPMLETLSVAPNRAGRPRPSSPSSSRATSRVVAHTTDSIPHNARAAVVEHAAGAGAHTPPPAPQTPSAPALSLMTTASTPTPAPPVHAHAHTFSVPALSSSSNANLDSNTNREPPPRPPHGHLAHSLARQRGGLVPAAAVGALRRVRPAGDTMTQLDLCRLIGQR